MISKFLNTLKNSGKLSLVVSIVFFVNCIPLSLPLPYTKRGEEKGF